jgi:hypothetical protein
MAGYGPPQLYQHAGSTHRVSLVPPEGRTTVTALRSSAAMNAELDAFILYNEGIQLCCGKDFHTYCKSKVDIEMGSRTDTPLAYPLPNKILFIMQHIAPNRLQHREASHQCPAKPFTLGTFE